MKVRKGEKVAFLWSYKYENPVTAVGEVTYVKRGMMHSKVNKIGDRIVDNVYVKYPTNHVLRRV